MTTTLRPRVLCADDKTSVLDLVKQILAAELQVTTVASGADAIAALSPPPTPTSARC